MIKVEEIKNTSQWTDIYKIRFKFHRTNYFEILDNIITFDTETSNGFMQPDHTVIGFNHELYDNDEEYRNKIDNAVEDIHRKRLGILP